MTGCPETLERQKKTCAGVGATENKYNERRFVPSEIKVNEGEDFHARKCNLQGWKSAKRLHNSAVT